MIKFFEQSQVPLLNEWLKERGHPEIAADDLPALGLMAYHEGIPVAAMFLRQCEGSLGILDSMATNPSIASKIRNESIWELWEKVLYFAEEFELKKLILFTVESSLIQRALEKGFHTASHQFLCKGLRTI